METYETPPDPPLTTLGNVNMTLGCEQVPLVHALAIVQVGMKNNY